MQSNDSILMSDELLEKLDIESSEQLKTIQNKSSLLEIDFCKNNKNISIIKLFYK